MRTSSVTLCLEDLVKCTAMRGLCKGDERGLGLGLCTAEIVVFPILSCGCSIDAGMQCYSWE